MLTASYSDGRDSGMCFRNNLSGDFQANVTGVRHSGDEKHCT
jgi:hypothetical protein